MKQLERIAEALEILNALFADYLDIISPPDEDDEDPGTTD